MENIKEERKSFESLGLSYPVSSRVKVDKTKLAGVDTYWFTPEQVSGNEVIVYLHGGGFIYGSVKSHKAMVSHIAEAIYRKILFVEYALAPEKPFPAALNETTEVIKELIRITPDIQFALMGDSAGGNLVMSTALNLKKLGMSSPLYQVLISPWVNMETHYPSYIENEKRDPIITKEFINYAAALYAGKESLSNPLMSPIHGVFTDFSPTLILVGAKEVLRDDSLYLHEALKKAGATSILKVFDDVTHVWTLTDISSAESTETLRIIHEFVSSVNKMSISFT